MATDGHMATWPQALGLLWPWPPLEDILALSTATRQPATNLGAIVFVTAIRLNAKTRSLAQKNE